MFRKIQQLKQQCNSSRNKKKQGLSRVMAGHVGRARRLKKKSRVEPDRVRRRSKLHGSGRVGSGHPGRSDPRDSSIAALTRRLDYYLG